MSEFNSRTLLFTEQPNLIPSTSLPPLTHAYCLTPNLHRVITRLAYVSVPQRVMNKLQLGELQPVRFTKHQNLSNLE